ncbi:MAG: amino acid adenylation domain-containing protein, partial [Calditrichaeota bacterium]
MSTHLDSKKNIEAIYPLSPMQQGMLFHSLYSEGEGEYFEQYSCKIKGDLNVEAFKRALSLVVQRHTSLRTCFVWKKVERMLQVVQREVPLPFELIDWSSCEEEEQQRKLQALLVGDRRQGFNLGKAPLMRFFLIRLGQLDWQFYWSLHHLLSDGWSTPIILKEVMTFYEAECQNIPLNLPPAQPFSHYIEWLEKQSLDKAKTFWQKNLAGFTSPAQMIEDHLTEVERSSDVSYAKIKREFSVELSGRLNDFGRQYQITLNTMIQGAWAYLHYRYLGENDIVFGATVSGRPPELPDVERIVGLFINTLPIRIQINHEDCISDWLAKVQAQAFEMRDYEYTPLVEIHGWSELSRETRLFNSIVVFENYPMEQSLNQSRSSLKFSDFTSIERTNYPLTLVASMSEKLVLEIAYDTRKYRPATISQFLLHLERILSGMALKPKDKLIDLPILNDAEIEKMTIQWNDTEQPFDRDLCLHQVFEKQVSTRPNAPAMIFHDQLLTFAELNRLVNQWAHHLRTRGVVPETLVAIYLERSAEMIIALLAVLKAGGAFVPIDPAYPKDRVHFILQDSQASLILTQETLADQISQFAEKCLDVAALEESAKALTIDNPLTVTSPENLAYIIYTSGSTGKPKGTLLQHRGAVNMSATFARNFRITPSSRFLQFSSIGFDASVGEILPTLLSGALLVVIDRETMLSASKLVELMEREQVTTAILPPSVLSVLPDNELPHLQLICSAGEACTPDIVKRWSRGRCYVNGYGPTENSVGSTFFPVDSPQSLSTNIPIGRPFDNVRIYVLDRRLCPVPIGAPGELCVGGLGLARGYLERPDMTAEKFIPDPFALASGLRMYRTGDLVRYLPDGNLEFLGRIDHQVKIRGFRIELGEIDAVLSSHQAVQDAAVVVKEGAAGQKILVGYYVPCDKSVDRQEEIKSFLKESLPDYMVPTVLMAIDAMPLNASGKVNRQALPDPNMEDLAAKRERIAPRNEIEMLLAGIWQVLLKCESVGITDSFFELGGHSLLATQMVSR